MIHYNFVREHSSIKKTPAEQAEIKLDLGQNKIENLIKMTSMKNNKWLDFLRSRNLDYKLDKPSNPLNTSILKEFQIDE